MRVDALVALQPDQLAVIDRGKGLGDLSLADADLAFEQDRAVQRHGDEQRGPQAAVGQVAVLAEGIGEVSDGRGRFHPARLLACVWEGPLVALDGRSRPAKY